MSSAEPSDTDLLTRWRGGESAAGERLFSRHFTRVERFFVNKVDPHHVADLVQETFVACVEGRDRIRDGTRFRGYLLGAAHNVLCGFLRRKYSAPVDELEHSIASLSVGRRASSNCYGSPGSGQSGSPSSTMTPMPSC